MKMTGVLYQVDIGDRMNREKVMKKSDEYDKFFKETFLQRVIRRNSLRNFLGACEGAHGGPIVSFSVGSNSTVQFNCHENQELLEAIKPFVKKQEEILSKDVSEIEDKLAVVDKLLGLDLNK